MKIKYKIFIAIIVIEACILQMLNLFGIKIESDIGNTIGMMVFCAPIFAVLIMLTREDGVSPTVKLLLKGFMFFIAIAIIGPIVLSFVM